MGCCARCDGAELGNLAAVMRARASTRVGDVLPRIVYPSDVDREKQRLHPLFLATDRAVAACSSLSAAERAGWQAFYVSWEGFRARETPLFGAANEWDLSQRFAIDLAGWQVTLATKCALAGPMVKPTDNPDAPTDLSALKWVAGAAIVVAGVYALKTIMP